MVFRVVCVSGSHVGTHLHEIATGVAAQLGFTLVDEAIIARAADEAGVDPHVVADVEQRQTRMARLLDALAASSDATTPAFAGGASVYSPSDVPLTEELRGLIRTAIEEIAARGNVVIVSHAASHALATHADVLRILVTASAETRCARLEAEHALNEEEAAREVKDSDAARADYLKRFYGVKQELPTQYELVVNTDRLASDDAVALITLAAGR